MTRGVLHEVWQCNDGPSCIHFGPAGDAARAMHLNDGGRCVWMFWAKSHYEAMQMYYEFVGYGKYNTDHPADYEAYPDSWIYEQEIYRRGL